MDVRVRKSCSPREINIFTAAWLLPRTRPASGVLSPLKKTQDERFGAVTADVP